MWWNGEPLPVPSPGIGCEYRIVEGTNSGQTLGGTYSKKIIARKVDLQVNWENLSAEESAVIGKINEGTYGKLTFYSPDHGRYITRTMHVESHTADISEAVLERGNLDGSFSASVQFREK